MIRRGYMFASALGEQDAMSVKEYKSPRTGVKYLARFLTDAELVHLVNENEDTIVDDTDMKEGWESSLTFIDEKTGHETEDGDTKTYEGVIIKENISNDPICRFVYSMLSDTSFIYRNREHCKLSMKCLDIDLTEDVIDKAIKEHLWKIEGKQWWFEINRETGFLEFGIRTV